MSEKADKIRSAADWRVVELPVLDETLCTGCGLCVAVCPTNCLAMLGHLPCLPRPRDCVSCGLCAAVCPANALAMQILAD
jgi:formate hydrogenlyase subunit 6/NADH:ubiquinone oxidoreductase subunit I